MVLVVSATEKASRRRLIDAYRPAQEARGARPRAQCCGTARAVLGELGSALVVCRLRRVVLWAVASCLSQPIFWTVAGRFATVRTLRTRDSATALPICDNRHRVITQCKVVLSRN